VEWLLFTLLSVLSLVLFRQPLMRRFNLSSGRPVDRIEGEAAIVLEEVAPGAVGKAELRGTTWSARTTGGLALARGQRCRVERVEGLTLWLRAE
jgi:membrane protein implicated in regulation of membrane protease activity